MSIMLKRSLLLLALSLCIASSVHARQQHLNAAPAGRMIKVAEQGISMRDAIERVKQQTGGRVLDAQPQDGGYRIKVLTPQGEVRIYRVDARTGDIR